MKQWQLRVGGQDITIAAEDQHAAWNTLRNRPLSDFGLIVTALEKGKDEDERIGVHTVALLLAWGRDEEARWLLDALRSAGVDDSAADLAYAFAHGRTAPFLPAALA